MLAFPKEQDLAWISAGGAAALRRITASAVCVAWLASLVIIQVMPSEARGAAGTNVGQNQTSITRGAGERSSTLAASAGGVASFTRAPLCVVSRRAVWNTVVPKQQVAGMLALQADTTSVMKIGHTVLAQRMAVSTVSNKVQVLLFLAAGLTVPTGESKVRVTGDTVRFQRPVALPAGWVALCTSTFQIKVRVWTLRKAAPSQ